MATMETTTDGAARAALRRWRKHSDAVEADRDPLVIGALAAGLAKEEVHQLTGISRSTIDRILEKRVAEHGQGFVLRHGRVKWTPTLGREYVRAGLCEICGRAPAGKPILLFDHCHAHGWVRGLLCNFCNDQLGFYESGQIHRCRASLVERFPAYLQNCAGCAA
jgi:hypothetical protein